ncbi:MAG: hypothetical protein RR945_11960 [Erysipelotrichaceae bacterium]
MGNNSILILLIVFIVSTLLVVAFKLTNNWHGFSLKFMYCRRRTERTDHNNAIGHMIAPSFICIVLCGFCLCSSSWAWFTASLTSGTTRIQAATYSVVVMAKQGETIIPTTTENSGIIKITLETAKSYNITLTPTGTAKSGFCKVSFENMDYYSEQLTAGSISFVVHASENSTLIITPQWGTCAIIGENNMIKTGTEIGKIKMAPISPMVESKTYVITEETPKINEAIDIPVESEPKELTQPTNTSPIIMSN